MNFFLCRRCRRRAVPTCQCSDVLCIAMHFRVELVIWVGVNESSIHFQACFDMFTIRHYSHTFWTYLDFLL